MASHSPGCCCGVLDRSGADQVASHHSEALLARRAGPKEVDQVLGLGRTASPSIPAGVQRGAGLADAGAEAFAQQVWNDRKQAELAQWLRFSRPHVRRRGDGLTPEALGLSPPAQALWNAALTPRQALRPSFRRSSIKLARRWLEGCAGFLLVTSTDRSIGSLLEVGPCISVLSCGATDLGAAHHAMSYADMALASQRRRPGG